MGDLLGYLLLNRDFHISEDTPDGEKVCRSLLAYYNTGEGAEEIQNLLSEYRKVIYENEMDFRIPLGNDYEKGVATSIRRRQLYELKDMTLTSTTEYVIGGMKYKVNSIFDIDTKDSDEALKRLMEKEIDKVS